MWDPVSREYKDASYVLQSQGLKPIRLEAKEGLAMINGTQLICALGAGENTLLTRINFTIEALLRAENAMIVANVVGAMTLEGQKGFFSAS